MKLSFISYFCLDNFFFVFWVDFKCPNCTTGWVFFDLFGEVLRFGESSLFRDRNQLNAPTDADEYCVELTTYVPNYMYSCSEKNHAALAISCMTVRADPL